MAERVFGADGTAHISYYDKTEDIAFVWDASNEDDIIGVSRGGFGEPVVDTFDAFDFDSDWEDGSLVENMARFEDICTRYISRMYDDKAIINALSDGYREGHANEGHKVYDGDPTSPRSIAYSTGRDLRRRLGKVEYGD